MKINCLKCQENLNPLIDRKFLSFELGNIVCPKCQKKQNRYISESDLLLFLLISEILYFILCALTIFLFNLFNNSMWMVFLLLPLLIIYLFTQRLVARNIYFNAYNKKDYQDFVFNENPKDVKRSIQFRMVLFYSVSVSFLALGSMQGYTLLFIILAIIELFSNYLHCLKRERKRKK